MWNYFEKPAITTTGATPASPLASLRLAVVGSNGIQDLLQPVLVLLNESETETKLKFKNHNTGLKCRNDRLGECMRQVHMMEFENNTRLP